MVAGLTTILAALYVVVVCYSSLPYLDGWIQITTAAGGGSLFSPSWLWAQHNEHRLLVPKLLLAIDLYWFHASQKFLLASIFVIQFLHLALLSWAMYALGRWRGPLLRTGIGLASFCLFCPAQWENFTWSFQSCFVLPQLFATAALVALFYGTGERQISMKWLVLSILSALGATYSLASGNLVWPLLILAAIYLRLPWKATVAITGVGIASTALYLHGYHRPVYHADPIASLHHPVELFTYWLTYFLNSWSHLGMHWPEGLFVLLVLIALAGQLSTPELWHFKPFAVVLLLLMAFYQGTSLLTAMGRLNFGFSQALSSRYQTVALLFWGSAGLLIVGSSFFREKRSAFLVVQICLLAIMLRGAILFPRPLSYAMAVMEGQRKASMALVTGNNLEDIRFSCFTVDPVLATGSYMRSHHLSIFAP